jgi:hypothetical protein
MRLPTSCDHPPCFLSSYPSPACSLVHLYNSLEDSLRSQKLSLISTIISYASNTKQLDQLAPYLAGAAAWQKEWQLSNDEARSLFLLLSRAYGKAGDASSAQVFLIRYLQTFEPSAGSSGAPSPAALEEAKEHAKEAAIGYIRAPALSQRSALAHLAAVSSFRPRLPSLFVSFCILRGVMYTKLADSSEAQGTLALCELSVRTKRPWSISADPSIACLPVSFFLSHLVCMRFSYPDPSALPHFAPISFLLSFCFCRSVLSLLTPSTRSCTSSCLSLHLAV